MCVERPFQGKNNEVKEYWLGPRERTPARGADNVCRTADPTGISAGSESSLSTTSPISNDSNILNDDDGDRTKQMETLLQTTQPEKTGCPCV